MQWRSFAFVAVVCWVLWPSVGTAQDNVADEQARFALFTYCEPVDVFMGAWDSDADELGLTEKSVQAAIESRLRSARVYSEESSYFLAVEIIVVSNAFFAELGFYKRLSDPRAGGSGYVATWQSGSVGIHGGDARYIRSALTEKMDEFLVEYPRVNESACQ